MSATDKRKPSDEALNASRLLANEADRRTNGRFKPRFDRLTLYKIVLEVSLLAADLDPVRHADPRTVTVRSFNKARHHLREKWGHIPKASVICKRLKDRNGKSWSWPDLLAAVHDPTRDIKNVDESRLAAPPAPMDDERLAYAALRVAYANGSATMRSDEYANGRDHLLQGITDRTAAEAWWFSKLLPTTSQMVWQVGNDWKELPAIVGLKRLPPHKPPKPTAGVDRALAIALYYAQIGVLPARCELEAFARERFALARDQDEPWLRYWIPRGQKEIRARGLPKPPPFAVRINRGWVPIGLDVGELPPPEQRERTMLEVYEWVRLFVDDPARGEEISQGAWRRFAEAHDGAPSWGSLSRRGGLIHLMEEAAKPSWEANARAIDAAKPKPKAKTRPRAGQRPARTPELERRAQTAKADEIVAVLRRRRRIMTAEDIADATGMPGRTVRYYIHALVAAERIDQARKKFDGDRTTTAYRVPTADKRGKRQAGA